GLPAARPDRRVVHHRPGHRDAVRVRQPAARRHQRRRLKQLRPATMNINLTLITQGVAFFLFIWFTVKFIWPPLLRAIEQRQKVIAEGLAAAEKGKQTLEASARQAEADLRTARERAADIVAQAEKRAAQLVDEARNTAREEGDREKAAAKA